MAIDRNLQDRVRISNSREISDGGAETVTALAFNQKRSKMELEVARSLVANKSFLPMPIFSSNRQGGEKGRDMISCNNIQENNAKGSLTKYPHQEPKPMGELFFGDKRTSNEKDSACLNVSKSSNGTKLPSVEFS
eukprot:632377-Ditylum_brightwellii.AAC.1